MDDCGLTACKPGSADPTFGRLIEYCKSLHFTSVTLKLRLPRSVAVLSTARSPKNPFRWQILGHIASHEMHRCVCCSVHWAQEWAVQKQLNRSRCRLGADTIRRHLYANWLTSSSSQVSVEIQQTFWLDQCLSSLFLKVLIVSLSTTALVDYGYFSLAEDVGPCRPNEPLNEVEIAHGNLRRKNLEGIRVVWLIEF